MRNGCQVGMEDAALVDRFPMTVDTGRRIEASSEFVLGTWGEFALVFDYDHLILIQRATEKVKVIIL